MGIWVFSPQGTGSLLARTEQQAPGTPPNYRFVSLRGPLVGAGGAVSVFQGIVDAGPDDRRNIAGIWTTGTDGLRLLALEGGRAPGVPEAFLNPIITGLSKRLIMSPDGRVAFAGEFTSDNMGSAEALWATPTPGGDLRLIAFKGRVGR
jgi:hypothetical protein